MFRELFKPITINTMILKNRLVTSAMESCYCDDDGFVTSRYIAYVEARAKGGWGMITNELTSVSKNGRAFFRCSELWDDKFIPGHKSLTEAIHRHDTKICIQLAHGGRQTGKAITGCQNVAPSALPCPVRANNPDDNPKELTVEEIKQIVGDFAHTVRRAKESGYDAIELHGAHGYLIQQFLSPFSNKRGDDYGGSLKNRCRFALEVIAAIRAEVGKDFPLIFRLSASEMMDAARLTIGDSTAIAMIMEEAGIDAINSSVGSHSTLGHMPVGPAALPHGYNICLAEQIKMVVNIPVFGNGRFNDPHYAESALRSGRVDIIAMGRASLADPEFPNKAKAGQLDQIVNCVACMQGCTGNLKGGSKPIECLVNPILGNELEYTFEPAEIKKKVAVVGAGVSGLAAAIAATRRGHDVFLYEKSGRLGGQFMLAAVPPFKQELANLISWQSTQIRQLGVSVHLNTEFAPEIAKANTFDAIIVTTGAMPIIPRIENITQENVMTAAEVLSFKKYPGKRVVVVGGGQVGSETAAHLASQNRDVTIVEMRDSIPAEGEAGVNFYLKKDLLEHNVNMIVNATVQRFEPNAVVYVQDGVEKRCENIDTIVIAIGSRSYNPFGDSLDALTKTVVVAGDATKAGKGLVAHAQGFRAGYYI